MLIETRLENSPVWTAMAMVMAVMGDSNILLGPVVTRAENLFLVWVRKAEAS